MAVATETAHSKSAKESTMHTEAERTLDNVVTEETAGTAHGPSADFIYAISEFLDTDPKDLLVELGYYASEPQAALTS